MFIHISPELEALGETLSTLKFAERVATVELGAARVNKDTSEVKELKEQVKISNTFSHYFTLHSFKIHCPNQVTFVICFQIASLKLAVARKESESDQTQLPRPLTPDKLLRRKSLGVSSSFSKPASTRQFQTKHKPSQIDDVNSIEVRGKENSCTTITQIKLVGTFFAVVTS